MAEYSDPNVNVQKIYSTFEVEKEVPCNRFWVRDSEGDDAQIRLEENGTVYLCYTKDDRSVIETREISFAAFVMMFREFVDAIV